MNKGCVYLIGAGPGDPGLLTVKGLDCLAQADVLIYDRLVNPALLARRKEGAELIYVGKRPDRHILGQEEINRLLVQEAGKGKIVARLKGGDPFVFGRGGEEAEALAEAGIPYEIVPGVTSAIAVPAYAGIPVTHRQLTSTLTIVTGHEEPGKEERLIDWDRLAGDRGTLVFLMGVKNLELIVRRLVEHGKREDTPAAVIQRGTQSCQREVSGTLSTICRQVREAGVENPAVIVIGEVVQLGAKLQWLGNRPLSGKRILVTRAREQASRLSRKIRELGGEPLEFPTIVIKPPVNWEPVDEALYGLERFQWVVFTSENGVEKFFRRLQILRLDIRALTGKMLCAIGPQTAQALEKRGLLVDYVPQEYRAEAVLEGLLARLAPASRLLLARAQQVRPLLAEGLKAAGFEVTEIAVYRTEEEQQNSRELLALLNQGEVDIITFTSSSTVDNFLKLLAGEVNKKILLRPVVACIGPITADTARARGLRVDVTARQYTIDGLMEALKQYYKGDGCHEFS